jgi:predicted transcriptional regulator of viral defense system
MDRLSVVKAMESHRMPVFTTQQFAALVGSRVGSASVLLSRLVKAGIVARIQRGRYALPSTNALAVASGIYLPSYVSLLSAFEYHGTTTQSPRVIDVINPVRSGSHRLHLEGGRYVLRFIKTTSRLIFGFTKEYVAGEVAFIAEKERAIVDGLLFPGYVPLGEAVSAIESGVDERRAMDYAGRTGKQSVLKRTGYLLSARGGAQIDPAGLSDTYVPLDPALPRRGRHDPEWRVIVNAVVE